MKDELQEKLSVLVNKAFVIMAYLITAIKLLARALKAIKYFVKGTKMKTVWDGVSFLEVSEDEAEKLVKEDKAQLIFPTIGGNELKFRKQFTGYEEKAEAMQSAPLKDWKSYKKVVAELNDIKVTKVTKSMVEEYLEDNK